MEVAEIVADAALRLEVRSRLPDLAEAAKPCGEAIAMKALEGLVLVFGRSPSMKAAAFWKPYVAALGAFPAEVVEGAVQDYLALPDAEFFPKPGPLRALAEKRAIPIYKALSRMRKVVALPPPTDAPPATVEERRAVAAQILKDIGAALGTRPTERQPDQPGAAA